MRKAVFFFFIAVFFAFTAFYFYSSHQPVKIIAAHQGEFTVAIIVDALPVSSAAKIKWWAKNEQNIVSRFNLKADNDYGYLDYYIYAWGKGYQEEGKKDRLCFSDMTPPKNCIDKKILMLVSHTNSGDTVFEIGEDTFIRSKDGKVHQRQ